MQQILIFFPTPQSPSPRLIINPREFIPWLPVYCWWAPPFPSSQSVCIQCSIYQRRIISSPSAPAFFLMRLRYQSACQGKALSSIRLSSTIILQFGIPLYTESDFPGSAQKWGFPIRGMLFPVKICPSYISHALHAASFFPLCPSASAPFIVLACAPDLRLDFLYSRRFPY